MTYRGDPGWHNRAFLEAIFDSRTAHTGGVVKRSVKDVEREIGEHVLVSEVRKRGFQMHRMAHHYVITCNDHPIAKLV
ncbi:MAG: N-(5'-phosphoribosyl)anthranilate isomerase [Pseudomonadota bacterium]